jgi:hypothetical protein
MESRVVAAAQQAGLIAERLAEGGSYDLGDVRIYTDVEWVIECKDRMALNVPQALEKALLKSGTRNTALVWRKMTRKNGNQNRTQDGPVIVALTLSRYLELLKEDR